MNTNKKNTMAVATLLTALTLSACANGYHEGTQDVADTNQSSNVTQPEKKGTEKSTVKEKKGTSTDKADKAQSTSDKEKTQGTEQTFTTNVGGNDVTVRPWRPSGGYDTLVTGNNSNLHARYLAAKAAYDKALVEYQKAHSSDKDVERGALEMKLAESLSKLATARGEWEAAKGTADKDRAVTAAAKAKFDAEAAMVATAQADRQKAIDDAIKAVDAKQAEVNSALALKELTERNLEDMKNARTVLTSKLEEAKADIVKAEKGLEDARTALKEAQKANAEEVRVAEERLGNAEKALSNARTMRDEAMNRLNTLKGELEAAKAQLVTAQANYDAEVSRLSKEAADLQKVVTDRQRELATAEGTASEAEKAKEAANGVVTEKQALVDAAEEALNKVKEADPDMLRSELADAERKLEEARNALNQATRDAEAATTRAQEEQAKYERMKAESETFVNFETLTSAQKMLVLEDLVAAIINQHRVDAGLDALATNDYHKEKARHWSKILADTQYGKVASPEYTPAFEGDVHDLSGVTGDTGNWENVLYVYAKGGFRVNWSESDGGSHVERVNLDKDPMKLAWVIAQQWRNSPGHYSAMMDRGVSLMSVGLHYDEATGRIYATYRGYMGKSDKVNPERGYHTDGLYMPTTHSDLFGFEEKKMEFTGIAKGGRVTADGENNHDTNFFGGDDAVRDYLKDKVDNSTGVDSRHATGIEDPRPTKEQVETQKGIAEEANADKVEKDEAKETATNNMTDKTAKKAEAQENLDTYLAGKKAAQAKLDEAKKVLELAKSTFGEKSAVYEHAAKQVEAAQEALRDAQAKLNAVPGVDSVSTDAVDEAKAAVAGKTVAVDEAQGAMDTREGAVVAAEVEKAEADKQMAKANEGFKSELDAVDKAEKNLEGKQSDKGLIEKGIEANENAISEAEALIEKKGTEAEAVKAELPALNEKVEEAKAVVVDTTKMDEAKAELEEAEKTSTESGKVEAEKKNEVTSAQSEANAAQNGINTIDQNKARTERVLEKMKNELIEAGKNAGMNP